MNNWVCYILKSNNKTYNGATNNIKRRIRQHNGELKGGAKSTKGKGPWEIYCLITGFISKIETLQTEWKIKTIQGRKRPSKFNNPKGRIKGLNEILKLEKFTSNSNRLIKEMNLYIYIKDEFKIYLNDLPKNITVKSISDCPLLNT